MSDDIDQLKTDPMAALTPKQRAFVEHYLACGFNATEAAKRAGYRDPGQAGYENKKKQEIRAAISARLAEHQMSADEVLARLSDIAHGSMSDFLQIERVTYHKRTAVPDPTPDDPKRVRWVEDPEESERLIIALDLEQARDRGRLHLLKKYKEGQWGPEVELHDPVRALELVGRAQGLFKEADDILKYLDLAKLSQEQLTRLKNGDDPISVLLNQ